MIIASKKAVSDLAKIINEIIEFRDKCDWEQYRYPKCLSQGISMEAAELREIFLWLTTEESISTPDSKLQMVKHEITDIFIYLVFV